MKNTGWIGKAALLGITFFLGIFLVKPLGGYVAYSLSKVYKKKRPKIEYSEAPNKTFYNVGEAILAFISGFLILFCGVLYYIGAANSVNIRNMLGLKYNKLIKIIVGGIGIASILICFFRFLGIFDETHINVKPMNLGVVIGGIIFGIGFFVGGACPGTIVTALGTNMFSRGIWGFVGGVIGALTYSLSYEWLRKQGLFKIFNMGKISLFRVSDKFEYIFSGGYIGLMLVGILLVFIAVIVPENRRGKKQ